MDLKEGDVFNGINTEGFILHVVRKMKGRKVLIKKIYRRMGAYQDSYVCIFLRNNLRQKDYEHTFVDFQLDKLFFGHEKITEETSNA